MLVMCIAIALLLVNVSVFAALCMPTPTLPNASDGDESVSFPPTPLPVRLMTCGLFDALSTAVSVPVKVPCAVGVKFTVTVQVLIGAGSPGPLHPSLTI